jgi:L-fuculose-phosphate aldolase
MHLRIYRIRPDIRAVVHAHPTVATRPRRLQPPEPKTWPSGWKRSLRVTTFSFSPTTGRRPTVGPTLAVAYNRMESLEHSARILLAARLLGRVPHANR